MEAPQIGQYRTQKRSKKTVVVGISKQYQGFELLLPNGKEGFVSDRCAIDDRAFMSNKTGLHPDTANLARVVSIFLMNA